MAAEREAARAQKGKLMICDFCSSESPAWRYPATSFLDARGSQSVSDWIACEECHALIAAGNRDGLAARALPVASPYGLEPALARRYARDLPARFWRARRVPPDRTAA